MLKQRSFFALLMMILQQVIGFVSLYFVSHYMGPKALGIIASSLAFCSAFLLLGDLGFGLAHVKKISEGKDLGTCNATFLCVKIILTLFVGLVALLAFHLIKRFGGNPPVPEDQIIVLYIILASVLLGNLMQTFNFTFAARLEKAKQESSLVFSKFVTCFLKIFTAICGLSILFLAWANLIGSVIGFTIALCLFVKLPFGKPDTILFKEYLKFAIPAFFISISSTLALQFDKIFISFFSNISEVGFYTAGQSIVSIITIISTIFISLLLPTYSKYHSEGKIHKIRELAMKIERIIAYPLMAIGMFLFFFSSQIQQILLGENFVQSSIIIKLLVLNAMILIIAQPYASQLLGMNKTKWASYLSVFVLFLNIVFYVVFIPNTLKGFSVLGYGAKGAALSLLLSNIIGTIIFRILAYKLSRSKPNLSVIIYFCTSSIVFGSIYFSLLRFDVTINIVSMILIALIGTAIYTTLLVILKQFSKTDILYYIDALNLKKLSRYIKEEFVTS